MIDLSNKIAVVTGSGSGFGAGITKLFTKLNATVIATDVNQASLKKVVADLNKKHSNVTAFKLDVTKSTDWKKLAQHIKTKYKKLDIIVNNAGYTHKNNSMFKVTEKEYDKVMNVNVKSIYYSTVHLLPIMVKNQSGSMINIASTAAVRPRPGITWYNGSKGAVLNLTKSIAAEVAKDNVRVNAINPVLGDTNMLADLIGDNLKLKDKFINDTIPFGRLSQPIDVANAVAFLASDQAEFITGTSIDVDGGRCI